MIRPAETIAGLAAYALADLGPPGAVSLAQNESFAPPSPKALAAGAAALGDAALYPDPEWADLRAAIAETHGLDPASILCGAGSMELIGCLIRAFAGPGDVVLGTAHGYLFTGTAARQAGARYETAPEPGLRVSVDAILGRVTPQTRIVFLCNPGNPTGARVAHSELLRLRDGLPAGVLLVIDQAYAEFDDQDPAPIFQLVARGDTVVLRTFSKAYALVGARVGWGVFPTALATETRKLLNPNNVSAASQAMAAAAMRDRAHVAALVAETARRRALFQAQVAAAGFEACESWTNFVMIRCRDADEAGRAEAMLRSKGLILRGMAGYGLPEALRATLGAEADLARVAATLKEVREHV